MASSFFLLLLILFLLGGNSGNNAVEAVNQDGLHLLEAKRLLTGVSSSSGELLADWNPRDATPCKWSGITCDDDDGSSVTEISLPDANLASSFPGAALCRLPRLRSINLNSNYIGPDLENKGGGCKGLQYLDLSMNSLVGPLPDWLADLPELAYLDLSSNNFSGAIPGSFARFRKLQSLGLVYNLLGGAVPPFLGKLGATLRELNLSYNPFSPGPVPPELGDLSSLRVLWLASCNLVGPIPASLGRLANLTDLDLSTNSLSGAIPPEIATGLTSVVQIELYNNSLSGPIPKGLGGLRHLRSLDISMNRLNGAIPDDLFGEYSNLETLHLYANELTGPLP